MRRGTGYFALALLASALTAAPGKAADHRDGPAATADMATDINDVYSWMSADGSKVYLTMTVFPAATTASKFSNAAYYVFHTASRANFLATTTVDVNVTCAFDQAQRAQCWVGTDKANYVAGDASAAAGISSKNGKIKLFAGLRDDPFFFNLDGFNETRAAVKAAVPALVAANAFDANGCPALNAATVTALGTQLQKGKKAVGMTEFPPPANFFKTLNTLAIVLEIDKTLLTTGGPIFSVWAGTHKTN
jgi:hypothetical protein